MGGRERGASPCFAPAITIQIARLPQSESDPAAAKANVNQYEIWWADLPEPVGTRPVLLLSRDGAYSYLARVLAVEVTTKIRAIPQEVVLGRREGMRRRCAANFDNLRAVPVSSLREQIGGVSTARVVELKRAFGHAVAWIELTGT